MILPVKFSSMAAVPPDCSAPDGQLAISHNILFHDGAMLPIQTGKPVLDLAEGQGVLFIHSVSGNRRNYIITSPSPDGDETDLLSLEISSRKIQDSAYASYFATINYSVEHIEAVGDILVIASDSGLKFFVWRDGNYLALGGRPPFVPIEFGLNKAGSMDDEETWGGIPLSCSPQVRSGAASPHVPAADENERAFITQKVFGLLLPAAAKIISDGYFYQPFFIRYAFRLFDGSYAWHSNPVLLLPVTTIPTIHITDVEEDGDGLFRVSSRLDLPYFELRSRILHFDRQLLERWRNIVTAIDIFISAPLYTFDQSEDLPQRPYTRQRNLYDKSFPYSARSASSNNADRGRDNTTEQADTVFFLGHYADRMSSQYTEHTASRSSVSNGYCWDIQPNVSFVEEIKNSSLFYRVASIDFDSLVPADDFKCVDMGTTDLAAIRSAPSLPDDYHSHRNIAAKYLYTFNSRINLAGIGVVLEKQLPFRSCIPATYPPGSAPEKCTVKVWSRINGVKTVSVSSGTAPAFLANGLKKRFPRFLFFPDSNAYKLEISFTDAPPFRVSLTPHRSLNGAFFFAGLDASPNPADAIPETGGISGTVPTPSKVYTSLVNNPFIFPVEGINTVGSGTVLALASAAKPLSQGQFGRFPIYAFTSEGIWALQIAENGCPVAVQPITQDVCNNIGSICQLDSSVVFSSDRGLLLLSGSQTQCLSDIINGKYAAWDSFPSLHRLIDSAGIDRDELEYHDCNEFFKNCTVASDYRNSRLVAFVPACRYALVYSFKTGAWASISSGFLSKVNSYVSTYLRNGNTLLDFSADPRHKTPFFILSRPLKLDAPEILKTIDAAVVRGIFSLGHVKTVLYGSNDFSNWFPVWSSRNHSLRGFSGSPYKAYAVALAGILDPEESINSISISFYPRFNDKLR